MAEAEPLRRSFTPRLSLVSGGRGSQIPKEFDAFRLQPQTPLLPEVDVYGSSPLKLNGAAQQEFKGITNVWTTQRSRGGNGAAAAAAAAG